jgi:hypothetical protein
MEYKNIKYDNCWLIKVIFVIYCFVGAFGCYVVDVFWLPRRILVDVPLRHSTTQVTDYLMKFVVCVFSCVF